MNIKSTYMKIGKGPKGIPGKKTQENAAKIWVPRHHLWEELMTHLEGLRRD